ncbi:MAG: inositol monophosphatase family protein [Candidatus Paceibacterota bacterium]
MKNTLIQIVRGAVDIIRNEAAIFTANAKENDRKKDDIVTSADFNAQNHYEKQLGENFPEYGIIGEEGLRKPGENYFTVDPLDGTKAFARLQAFGVSTLLAMVEKGEVVAAFVGDVNTNDVYGFTPEDEKPFRIRFGVETPLKVIAKDLHNQYAVLHSGLHDHPEKIQRIVQAHANGGCFKNFEVMGGSAGTLSARLWTGEIGAIVFDAPYETPWDATPLLGMNKKLGFVHIVIDKENGTAKIVEPELIREPRDKDYCEIIVHKDNAPVILDWFLNN